MSVRVPTKTEQAGQAFDAFIDQLPMHIFTIKDIGVTHRNFNHVKNSGLVDGIKKSERRLFNIYEVVWIRIVAMLYKLGYSSARVASIKNILHQSVPFSDDALLKLKSAALETMTQNNAPIDPEFLALFEDDTSFLKLLKENGSLKDQYILKTLVDNVFGLGQRTGVILCDEQVIPFIESHVKKEVSVMDLFSRHHTYIAVDQILSNFYSNLDIQGRWRDAILSKHELALLDSLEKMDFKEIIIKPLKDDEKASFTVRVKNDGNLSPEARKDFERVIKKHFGTRSYHSISLTSRNNKLSYFENESIHSDGLGAIKPPLENPTDSAGPDNGDQNVTS